MRPSQQAFYVLCKGELQKALGELADKLWQHPITKLPVKFNFSTIERWFYQAKQVSNPWKYYARSAVMNYYLVSLAVSSITHESACSLIQHEIDRAGLKNTYIPCTTGSVYPKSVLARLADGYVTPTQGGWSNTFMEVFSRYPKVMLPGVHPVIGYNITPLAVNMSHWDFPAGGIVSSSDDLVRWYEALFSGKLVDKKILKEMSSWVPMGDGGYYGLATKKQYLKQYKSDVYFHGGDQLAYVTNVLYIKRFNLIIALTTSSDNDYTDYIDKGIISDVLRVLLNSPYP